MGLESLVEVGGNGPGGGPLRKALGVLEVLAGAPRPLSLSELSRTVDLPKSTLHRLMRVLTDLRLAVRMESKSYELGDYIFQLAATRDVAKVQNFSYSITPFLLELFQLTGKMVSVGMLTGMKVQHAGTLYGQEHSRLAMAMRKPVPAHCSAAGKLLLAKTVRHPVNFCGTAPVAYTQWTVTGADRMKREFEMIRSTGLSYARSEYIPELVEVAAPIHLGNADPVAAIVIGGTVNRTDLKGIGRILLDAVGSIEEKLAGAC
ncbi:IclR family transcriptional regulator C-terminal domain-containing protein [Umezawaea sp. Da 62-37]|uniref:IclR family transcriptional regulator n=1 Tax=Umezawaea sp. Da 62-37 TaxID=3075927 RepID=UPI0028F6F3AF|nr:IclR family transcriptional regulator C-terminal domain-containing protein [Umezawaea sp. Da 62-37]WNV87310.1 IclR family transcriptional regulator C-terminal domain-containing protein [Umezawaea sp. Da 62-37]